MKSSVKETYRLLIKQYNISFDGPIEQDDWPASHRTTFQNIRELGQTEFARYRASISADSGLYPWREQTRRRAERIASLATQCRASEKNEAGWRLELESEILVRFTVEVACRNCRARLWRSELEAAVTSCEQFAEDLTERRKRRVPCSCKQMRWNETLNEQGICLLFDNRAEENIVHDDEIKNQLPKSQEKPDRVYGLRMTRKLEQLLLYSEDKRPSSGGKTIGESVRTSPFRSVGEPLIFPFLVVEAKSEKGQDSFSDIEVQTAFTIRTLLKLQQDLRNAASEESETRASPLVWFLSYKGEQWRVSAAFLRVEGNIQTYRIVDLWHGRIMSREGALRLLLIVDYIFDWARDIHRETIISELQSLSANNTRSLRADSDIYSMLDRRSPIVLDTETAACSDINDDQQAKMASDAATQVSWSLLDSPFGAVRDMRYIKSKFMSLYITEDNLQEFTQSFRIPEEAQNAAGTILNCLKGSWRVHAEALDHLEVMWTGKDRENPNLYSPTKVFLVFVTISFYLSPSWEQTRELSYLAVSEDVVQTLLRFSNQKAEEGWPALQLPLIKTQKLVHKTRKLQKLAVQCNLLATIKRHCYSTVLCKKRTRNNINPSTSTRSKATGARPGPEGDSSRHRRYDSDVEYSSNSRAHARDLISSVYELHKIGRNEPKTSILRLSARLDEQKLRTQSQKRYTTHHGVYNSSSLIDNQTVYVVVSKNPGNGSQYPELCLFCTTQASHSVQEVNHLKMRRFEVLRTRRVDTQPIWRVKTWNVNLFRAQSEDIIQRMTDLRGHFRELLNPSPTCATDANNNQDKDSVQLTYKPIDHWNDVFYDRSLSVDDKTIALLFLELLETGNILQRLIREMDVSVRNPSATDAVTHSSDVSESSSRQHLTDDSGKEQKNSRKDYSRLRVQLLLLQLRLPCQSPMQEEKQHRKREPLQSTPANRPTNAATTSKKTAA